MANCTYRFTDRDGKERVIQGQAAFKAYLAEGGLQHLLPKAPIAFSRAQELKPEDVLKPETIAAAQAAIDKYKKAEPPDPLTTEERSFGEEMLQPLYDGAKRNKPEFDKTLDRIGEEVGGYAKKPGIKKPYRAVTKLVTESFWKRDEIKDLLRGTIVVSTLEDVQNAMDAIGKVYKFDRIKNRLSIDLTDTKGKTLEGKPLPTGYQDVLTNVVLPDGTVAEIQISTPEMLAAKHLGHDIYAFEREMPNSPVKTKMVELQRTIYAEGLGAYEGRAANALKTRSNSALSTGSPFSRTSEGLRGSGSGPQAVAERQSAETVTGTPFQSKNIVPGGKDLKSNVIGTSAPIISESTGINRAEQKNAAASRVEGTSADRFKRTPELQQAVADLQEGKITRDEYNRMVDESRPVYPYAAVPAVTAPKDARYALANGRGQSAEKAAKYGRPSMTLIKGDWAQLRLDIPSYQEHDAWVVSVHTPKSTNREVQAAYDAGPVVGYESVAALTDVTFGMNQKMAARIATGTAKGTIATMLGKWNPISKADAKARAEAAMKDPAWTQVGMDPFRHSYFYDRDTMRPVLAADEVIQIGPLVLAKNVKFGQETDVTGAPIMFSAKQTTTPQFKKWFDDSKVVDDQGKPIVVYHGTRPGGDINVFESRGPTDGVYFTPDIKYAEGFTENVFENTSERGAIYPAYLSMQKPYIVRTELGTEKADEFLYRGLDRTKLQAQGFDGAMLYLDGELDQIIAFEPTQIKSATGNIGTFDETNPDIRFAKRQPVGKETEGWLLSRDELGRFRFGAGAKAYRYAADVANAVLDVVGLKPVSPELSRAMRKMRVEIDKAQNLTVDVAKTLKDLPEQERQMISDVIEGELKRGAKPPKRVLEIAASMQSIMSEQSAELVRLGMLTQDAAGRWDGKYLPRFYEQKLGDETKAWMKAVKGLLGRKQTMQGIKGSSLKARGMFETVPVADVADWEAEGWEVRDPSFDPAVDTEITVWRDYTRTERDDMGEIRDAMFRFVMGYNKSQRDIALGRLYENLAATYAKPGKGPVPEGYVEVPKTNVEDTFVKRYGKLAGKYVPSEILDQLTAFDSDMQNDLTKIYMKGLSMWKEGKTVLNPVAHANNVLSNVTMAHFAGVSYWDAHKYIGSIKDLVKGDPMVDEAKDAGLFGGTFNRAELADAMPEELRVLAQMAESKSKRAVEMVWNGLSLWLRKPLGKAYNAEDEFFRYVVYRDARNNGLSVDDSVDYALKYMFSYDDMPKGARVIRDMPVGLPFFSYTYKIVPALVNTALEHPARYAAPAVALYVANAAMYAIAASLGGGDDEDWWTIIRRYMTDPEFRQKTKDLEQQERKNLPEWSKGASLSLGTEKTIRLGMDDLTNLPVFLDVSRIFPGGDLFDAHNNAGGIPLLAPITPNSPVLTTVAAMLFNKDTFRGKELVKESDTSAEAAQKRAAWMWKQITPAIAVGNTHFERAMNVIANVTGQPVNVGLAEYTGIGKDGLPIQPGYAALQTVGIKARPIDLDTSDKIQQAQTKALIRELETQIRQSQRLENKGAITPSAGEAAREKLREKKANLRQGLTVEGEEKD